jgi:prevent-host-death family protein
MSCAVGTKELKNRLSEYLRLVRRGQRVVVTDRGDPVAEIRPFERDEVDADLGTWLARLAARGVLRRGAPGRPARFEPVKLRGGSLADTIAADRR